MSTTDDSTCCANCGRGEEESKNLKVCTACKMVKYCNRDCQIAHRPQHKKACKKRAAELHDEKLFKEPPPLEDCPICFLPMPGADETMFKVCCGKVICDGCSFAVIEADMMRGKSEEDTGLCPYCRTLTADDEETVKRIKNLLERGNAEAYNHFAGFYYSGQMGLPQDYTKANKLFLKAGELGCTNAFANLGNQYRNGEGVDVDMKKAKYFYELAAMNGDADARYNLGCMEGQAGNHHRAMKHMVIAAKSGDDDALIKVKEGFAAGLVTKDEYEQALRACHEWQVEMKSEARDKAAEFRLSGL